MSFVQSSKKASLFQIEKMFIFLGICFSLGIISRLLFFHIHFITLPTPQEFREGSILSSSQLLVSGKNPYSLKFMPAYANGYGILYNIAALPFTAILGVNYPTHRFVSFLFIISSGCVIAWYLKKQKADWALTLIVVAYYYIGSVTQSLDMLSRADSLGFLFFLLAALTPVVNAFTRRSLVWSIVFSLLGFFTKPYFVLPILLIFIYLCMFVSKKRAIKYGFFSLFCFVIAILMFQHFFETYFINVIFNHLEVDANMHDVNHMISQLKNYVLRYPGLIAAFFVLCLKYKEYLLTQKYFMVCLCVNFFLFITKFGQNNGNTNTYLTHLVSPFLLLLVTSQLSVKRSSVQRVVIVLLVIGLSLWFFKLLYRLPVLTENTQVWQRIEKIVDTHTVIYNSPIIVDKLLQKKKVIYDNGLSGYYGMGILFSRRYNVENEATHEYMNFVHQIANDIKEKKYEVVFTTSDNYPYFTEEYLSAYYYVGERLIVPMLFERKWELEVWYPQ